MTPTKQQNAKRSFTFSKEEPVTTSKKESKGPFLQFMKKVT